MLQHPKQSACIVIGWRLVYSNIARAEPDTLIAQMEDLILRHRPLQP